MKDVYVVGGGARWAEMRALHEAEKHGGPLCPNCKAAFEDPK